MYLANHGIGRESVSKLERRVQSLAGRRAKKQLLQVPWPRFRQAYEEYAGWQVLTLWARAVIAAEGRAPSELLRMLREHCPGFIESESARGHPNLLAFHLLEWVHAQKFGDAKRQDWFDALTFYGVRHPRSECAWAYSEHCETAWKKNPPKGLPPLGAWGQQAWQVMLCESVRYVDLAKGVEKYLHWETLALWLRPLLLSGIELPGHVLCELERRYPEIRQYKTLATAQDAKERARIWQQVSRHRRGQRQSEARGTAWPSLLLERVRTHPLHLRLVVYAKLWAEGWATNRQQPYPSLRQWRRAADRYVKARA
ncbi:MAG: hypothetical protein WAN10_01210 [Candidatus Acidiferrales bacterium]